MSKGKKTFIYILSVATILFFWGCFISSCGKSSTVLPQASNTFYQVVNLSPDLLPVDLYIDVTKKNTTPFSYPNPSGYFSLTSVDLPFQIRSSSTTVSTTNIFSFTDTIRNNLKYTLWISGLKSAQTLTSLLTIDSARVPLAGRGKIRFINVSPNAAYNFDIIANGTTAFISQPFMKPSKYIEFPVGTYDFKVTPTGVPNTILTDFPGVTVQDGKIYTIYARGIVGRTDSAAFGLNMINNN